MKPGQLSWCLDARLSNFLFVDWPGTAMQHTISLPRFLYLCCSFHATGWLLDYTRDTNKTEAPLPDRFNWKAYWGDDPGATIVHFHGPKPRRMNCIECFVQQDGKEGWEKGANCTSCVDVYVSILNIAKKQDGGAMYKRLLDRFHHFMAKAGKE